MEDGILEVNDIEKVNLMNLYFVMICLNLFNSLLFLICGGNVVVCLGKEDGLVLLFI